MTPDERRDDGGVEGRDDERVDEGPHERSDQGPADDSDRLSRRTLLQLSALTASGVAADGAARVGRGQLGDAAVERAQERPDITGFHAPQIDGIPYGHAGEQLPQGAAGEWADALTETVDLVSSGAELTLSTRAFTKKVGSRLYLGLLVPLQERNRADGPSANRLSRVLLYVDRTGSGELSDGDARLVATPIHAEGGNQDPAAGIRSVRWTVEVRRDGQFVPQDDDPRRIPTTMMASDAGDGGFGFECRVDLEALDHVLDGGSDDQERFNLNVELLFDDQMWGLGHDPAELPEPYPVGGGFTPRVPDFPLDNSSVGRIEITQSVQDEENSLPLAQEKQTLARVFVDHPESSPIEVDVRLDALGLPTSKPVLWRHLGTLTKTTTVPPTPHNREEHSDSVNFELPASWRSKQALIVRAEVDRPGRVPTGSDRSATVLVTLGDTYDPSIWVGRVDGPNGRPTRTARDFHMGAFRRLMPLANVRVIPFSSTLISDVSASDALLTRLDLIATILKITQVKTVDQVFGLTVAYPGLGGLSSPSWTGGVDSHMVAWGREIFEGGASSSMDHIVAHEINHNIGGRKWAFHLGGPCGSGGGDTDYGSWRTGEVGWSPGYTRMIPKKHPELMSYCNSTRKGYSGPLLPFQWVSKYRWELLYDRFRNWVPGSPKHPDFGGPSPGLASDGPVEPGSATTPGSTDGQFSTRGDAARADGGGTAQESTGRVISGVLYPDGTGELRPSFEIPGETDRPSIRAEDPDAFLRVGYPNRTVELGIDVSFESREGEEVDEVGFNYAFPDDGGIDSIALLDAETGDVLDAFEATDFAVETADVDVPQTFARDQEAEVGVSVRAQSQVPLYRQLLYSPGGDRWLPFTGPFTEDSLPVEFTDGPGGEAARFLLLVSDGVRTERFESDPFTVPSLAPDVRIARAQRLVVRPGQGTADTRDPSTADDGAGTDEPSTGDGAADTDDPVDGAVENVGGPVETVVGATVSFQAYGTTEDGSGLAPEQFEWTIEGPEGDRLNAVGSLGGERMIHRFARPGTYTVRMTGTEPESELSSDDDIDVVVSRPPLPDAATVEAFEEAREQPPDQAADAAFGYRTNFLAFVVHRKTVPFDASESESAAGEITEYAWDFDGDGQFEERLEEPTTTHVFGSAGEHPVALRVTDAQGNTATTQQTLLVRRRVPLSIKPGGDDGPAPINPNTGGVTPVAVLGRERFDPAVVDVESLAFGPPDVVDPETEAEGAPAEGSTREDVDGDDVPDLVVRFPTRDAGFEQGDEVGAVVGSTGDGTPLVGADAVEIVGQGGGG